MRVKHEDSAKPFLLAHQRKQRLDRFGELFTLALKNVELGHARMHENLLAPREWIHVPRAYRIDSPE